MDAAQIVKDKGEIALSGGSLTELMRAVLAKGKPFRFEAKGFSMSPFIKDGDVITVRPLLGVAPRTGDIVAFLLPSSGRAAVHRIIGVGPRGFTLRGDNAGEADGCVSLDRILGIVDGVDRNGRRITLGTSRIRAAVARLSRSGVLYGMLQALRRAARRSGIAR